jgi:hypothetical protein
MLETGGLEAEWRVAPLLRYQLAAGGEGVIRSQ